jgi:putative endopeptidase
MTDQSLVCLSESASKFDASGVIHNWWSPADRQAFDARTQELGAQFADYEPLPGQHINAVTTLAENVADTAGLAVALRAYHLSLRGRPATVIDGFSGDQRFFMAFAQVWRTKIRDDALRSDILNDVHSPARFRAIGPVRNQDAWYAAFGVKPGERYYLSPDQRIHLW